MGCTLPNTFAGEPTPLLWSVPVVDHTMFNRTFVCEGMLAGLDWAVGRLLAHLRATGQYNRTLIVFGTDVRMCFSHE